MDLLQGWAKTYLDEVIGTIQASLQPNSGDDITKCGPSVVHLLSSCADAVDTSSTNLAKLLQLASFKLYAFRYDAVPACWRRLYTDASLLLALYQLIVKCPAADIIRTLDMAVIMTGVPGCIRSELVEQLIDYVQPPRPLVIQDVWPEQTCFTRPVGGTNQLVAEMRNPPFFEFEIEARKGKPLLLKNAITWPALDLWRDPNYFLRKMKNGQRLVPVEIGRKYTDHNWQQKIMTFEDFLERIFDPKGGQVYLAQHNLFAQVPSLHKDISIPDYCYANLQYSYQRPEEVLINAWFGPGGTVSPLHNDPYCNAFAQVVGHKYVRLYAPSASENLYPMGTGSGIDMGNTSSVDVETPDFEKYPKFRDAEYLEAVLAPGDILFVPVGWWHYVTSMSVSLSVSFWF